MATAGIWEWVARVISIAVIPVIALSAVLMIRSIGRQQRVRPAIQAVQALAPFVVLAVYGFILSLDPPTWLSVVLLAVGVALGTTWALTQGMDVTTSHVVTRQSVWTVVVWTVTLAATQAFVVFTAEGTASLAFASLYFSAGLAAGLNVTLLLRAWMVTARASGSVVSPWRHGAHGGSA